MVYKRYCSPFEQPHQQKRCPEPPPPPPPKEPECVEECKCESNKLFGKFDCDTVLILGLIAILLLDDSGDLDLPLIIALVFLLINN